MNIIAVENYKILKDKSFRIFLLISAVFFLIFGISVKADGPFSGITGMTAPYYMQTFVVFILMLCGAMASIIVVNDFDKGTIRNVLSTGTSRVAYYLSKLYTMFLSCTILTLVSSIIFTITITILAGWNGTISGHYILNLLVFYVVLLIQMFSYCSLFVMIAFLIRNVAGAIGITYVYVAFLEGLIITMLTMPGIAFLDTIAEFMPSIVIGNLMQFVEADTIMTLNFAITAIPALIIVAITILVGIMSFKKRDIK